MKHQYVLFCAAVLLTTAPCLSARAQTNRPAKPLAVKLGLFFPSGGDLANAVNEIQFSAGVSYDFKQTHAATPVVFQFYGDYADYGNYGGSGAGHFEGERVSSGSGSFFGVGPAAKFLLAPARLRAQPYVGLGAGYYSAKMSVPYVLGASSNGNRAEQTYGKAGGKLFAGYQRRSGFFGEADYTYIGEIGGVHPGGFSTRIGFRF